jgi:hypothetical protein
MSLHKLRGSEIKYETVLSYRIGRHRHLAVKTIPSTDCWKMKTLETNTALASFFSIFIFRAADCGKNFAEMRKASCDISKIKCDLRSLIILFYPTNKRGLGYCFHSCIMTLKRDRSTAANDATNLSFRNIIRPFRIVIMNR